MDLQLNVINITDELYNDAFYRGGAPHVYVAPGRSVYVTARIKYCASACSGGNNARDHDLGLPADQ